MDKLYSWEDLPNELDGLSAESVAEGNAAVTDPELRCVGTIGLLGRWAHTAFFGRCHMFIVGNSDNVKRFHTAIPTFEQYKNESGEVFERLLVLDIVKGDAITRSRQSLRRYCGCSATFTEVNQGVCRISTPPAAQFFRDVSQKERTSKVIGAIPSLAFNDRSGERFTDVTFIGKSNFVTLTEIHSAELGDPNPDGNPEELITAIHQHFRNLSEEHAGAFPTFQYRVDPGRGGGRKFSALVFSNKIAHIADIPRRDIDKKG